MNESLKCLSVNNCVRTSIAMNTTIDVGKICNHINSSALELLGQEINVRLDAAQADNWWLEVTLGGNNEIPNNHIQEVLNLINSCFDGSMRLEPFIGEVEGDLSIVEAHVSISEQYDHEEFLHAFAHELNNQDRSANPPPVIYQIHNKMFLQTGYDPHVDCIFEAHYHGDHHLVGYFKANADGVREFVEKYNKDCENSGYGEKIDIKSLTNWHFSMSNLESILPEHVAVYFGCWASMAEGFFLTRKAAERHLNENRLNYHPEAAVHCVNIEHSVELERLLNIISGLEQ